MVGRTSFRVAVFGGSGFIGSHFTSLLKDRGYEFINLDVKRPKDSAYLDYWREGSIEDEDLLTKLLLDFSPTHIVNFAALATMDAESINSFSANINGVETILNVLSKIQINVETVFVSTQHVIRPGSNHKEILNYVPYELYGKSKMLGEKIIREDSRHINWTIVRPTNIYGEEHPNLKEGLWDLIYRGYYFHPSKDTAVKCYGYVKNTCWQILKIIESSDNLKFGKIFYLGDGNISQEKWITEFEVQLRGKRNARLPKTIFALAARLGSTLGIFGIKLPITIQRYRNLITSNVVPVEETMIWLGSPPYTMEEGVRRTAEWVKKSNERESQ